MFAQVLKRLGGIGETSGRHLEAFGNQLGPSGRRLEAAGRHLEALELPWRAPDAGWQARGSNTQLHRGDILAQLPGGFLPVMFFCGNIVEVSELGVQRL